MVKSWDWTISYLCNVNVYMIVLFLSCTPLCTVAVNGKDFSLIGTAPAAGETHTETAGATISGFCKVPNPGTRSLVCTYSATSNGTPRYDSRARAATG